MKTPAKAARKMGDGLVNVATGQGTARDRSTQGSWTLFNGAGLGPVTPDQINAAYRTSWLVRKIHDIVPEEMVKAWRLWSMKAEAITKLEAEEKRLGLKSKTLQALRFGRLWGGGALVMGLPGRPDTPAPKPESLRPGELAYLFPVDRAHITVQDFITDLMDPFFGEPASFRLASTLETTEALIHPSRVIPFKGMPAPDIFTSNRNDHYWGLPLMETLNDPAQDATVVQRAIAALMLEAKVDVISIPGLTDLVSTADGEAMLSKRLIAAQTMKSIFQALVIDGGKEGIVGSGETYEAKEITLNHLPEIGRFMLQVAAGAADIPVTRLIGAPPTGMNATGAHDEENFLKMVRAKQGMDLRPALERLDPYLLASAGVKLEAEATWDFAPLETMTPAQQADLDNTTADTFVILKESGLFPLDALAAVATAALDEHDTFPGLAEAVAASKEDPPYKAEAEQAAAAAEAALKPPTVAGMVPNKVTPRAGAGGAMRRVAKAANDGSVMIHRTLTLDEIRDGTERTLYIGRKVLNPQEVLNHFRAQGVDGLEAAGDLHVTVIYSTTPVDWLKMPGDWSSRPDGRLAIPPGGPRVLEMFGPREDKLVQAFASDALAWRNRDLRDAGCSYGFEDYVPHITLVDDAPVGFDPAALKPYAGRILLGPEIWEEVRDPDGDLDQDTLDFEMVES